MRAMLIACVFTLVIASSASASQWPVIITTSNGEEVRGRLLSITPEQLTISRDGAVETMRLDTLTRVVKPRDSIGDGLLKGFLIAFVPALIASRDAGIAAQYGAAYGLIGAGIDALHGDSFVVYDRTAKPVEPVKPAIGWSIRF
jgi:hypothetical protein